MVGREGETARDRVVGRVVEREGEEMSSLPLASHTEACTFVKSTSLFLSSCHLKRIREMKILI